MTDASTLRRAAIVLAILGEDLAAAACAHLPRNQVRRLGEEVARLGHVSAEEVEEALAEFADADRGMALGGAEYARSLLAGLGLSEAGATRCSDEEATDLSWLSGSDELDLRVLAGVLASEHPQLLAVVVSHLRPDQTGLLLADFDEHRAAEIAYRAAHLAAPAPGVLAALSEALAAEIEAGKVLAESGGMSVEHVADLLLALPPERRKGVLESLSALDREFADAVAERVFTFDDITSLSDHDLQALLRSVDMSLLVVALKGTSPELRERVKANLSQRGRERLAEEMEVLGAVPVSQVQEARRAVCAQARVLADRGEISLDSAMAQYLE